MTGLGAAQVSLLVERLILSWDLRNPLLARRVMYESVRQTAVENFQLFFDPSLHNLRPQVHCLSLYDLNQTDDVVLQSMLSVLNI